MKWFSRNKHASAVPPEDHIPFKQKMAYSAGGAVDWFTSGTVGGLWMPVFNLGYGISPAKLGLVMVIFRIWDALSDPIIGNISDNTRTRWGRRRPYIFVGAILAAMVTPFMWRLSPAWSEMTMLAYITMIGLLLYTCTTIWAMSYNSLALEMTPNYDERTRLAAYRTIFTKFGVLVGGWILPFAASGWFADPATGKPDLVNGIQHISIGLALVVVVLGTLPAIFVEERYYKKEASRQAKEPLLQGMRDSFKLQPLWMMIAIVCFQVFGNGLTGAIGFYINVFYINAGKLADAAFIEGLKGSIAFVVGMAAVPFWTWVCEKLDKKWTLMIILGSGFISLGLNLVCLNPLYPYLQIVPAVFYASVTASLWLILPSMLADIVDFDEIKTFRRREGNVNAVFSWFFKLFTTVSVGLSGFILTWTGFDASVGETQPDVVLKRMVTLYILLPAICWSVAVVLCWFYPLNRKRMSDIRAELEVRRGKV